LVLHGLRVAPTLPLYNSSAKRRSAAWFVAVTMTRRGTKPREKQVARICRGRPRLAPRLREFLLGGIGELPF
jgi:hypothetical protein